MTTKLLFMEPVDGWSFRDGRPFEVGESFDAGSVFPPYPWTTLGCIRTTLLRERCGNPERYAGRRDAGPCQRCGDGPCSATGLVGPAGGPPPFAVGPPLLASAGDNGRVEVFFPAPADLVDDTSDSGTRTRRVLGPRQLPDGVVSSLAGLLPVGCGGDRPAGRLQPAEERWLSVAQIGAYLRDDAATVGESEAPDVVRDPRIGVAIDPRTRGAREGQLYVREFVALRHPIASTTPGLAVHLFDAAVDLRLDGVIGRLGGDGRMARFREFGETPLPQAPRPLGRRIKVYLTAPAWLAGGRLPRFIESATLSGSPPGCDVRLRMVAAALAPTVSVGGWDLARQQPRPIRRLVGAGSVFYFDVLEGDPGDAVSALHGRPFGDEPEDVIGMKRAGFGLALVGRWGGEKNA